MKTLLLTVFTLFYTFSFAQKIQILDKNTNQPIPFVNVRFVENNHGISADIDGYISLKNEHKSLIISHVNYQTLQINTPFSSKIYLIPKLNDLLEVVVNSINPAIRIIKKAIENREFHNPKNLNSFTHYAYSRLYADIEKTDSVKVKKLNNQHLFMSESRTKHDFLKPNREQETILAHKTSGIKSPLLASALTDFQPFTFYDELIYLKVMEKTYVNPISKNAWKKYDFDLIDTLITDSDSTFVITFEPKQNATFEGFKGFLHINSDGYALENISVEPERVGSLLTFKMQQRYERVDKKWFPKQQNSEIILVMPNGKKQTTAQYTHKTYLSDILINNEIKKNNFSDFSRVIIPKSYVKEDTFWDKYRSDSLSSKEKKTYQFYENLPTKKLDKLDKLFDAAEVLLSGYMPFRKFKIPISSLYKRNAYEGNRLGFGLRTGESISKTFELEANIGYGFRDKALKYSFLGQINLKNPRTFFQISYKQDLAEPATIDEGNQHLNITDLSVRNFLIERMDSLQQAKIQFQTPISRTGRVQIGLSHELRNPIYPYQFSKNEVQTADSSFKNTSVNISLRWAWGEKYSQIGSTIYQSDKPTKVLQIYAERGFKGIFDSEFDFTKLNISFQQRFATRNFGTTDYQFIATKTWGEVPYSFLSNGLGSSNKLGPFVVQNAFQTMGLYEFTSDQQVTLFIKQNFGRLIPSKSSFFQPEFSFTQGISYGSLQNANYHKNINLKTLESGYFESGLMIDKLLRIKQLNFYYLEFGVGVFARYGAYTLPTQKDNFALKFNFGVSF
jgi:hypothetical protein